MLPLAASVGAPASVEAPASAGAGVSVEDPASVEALAALPVLSDACTSEPLDVSEGAAPEVSVAVAEVSVVVPEVSVASVAVAEVSVVVPVLSGEAAEALSVGTESEDGAAPSEAGGGGSSA